MENSSFWTQVKEVLCLLKERSKKYQPAKPAMTVLGRLLAGLILAGGLIFFGAEVLRQLGDLRDRFVHAVWLSLAISGLLVLTAGTVAGAVETFRTIRRPFVEHIDRILEALDCERELIAELARFETAVLKAARQWLQLQSTKVASRLSLIGGGEGLRTSFVGVVILAGAVIFQYQSIDHGWTMKVLTFLGVVLLLGLSVGGLSMRYGASQADYYIGIIDLALQQKAYELERGGAFNPNCS